MKPFLVSVLPRPPHPTRDGLAIRNYHLLAALAGEFRVLALALLDPERDYGGEAPPGVALEAVPQTRRGRRRAAAVAGSLLVGGAYSARLYRSRALEARVAAAVRGERPAWVLAHSYHVAPGALSAGAPVWIDFHNLDAEIWRRVAGTAASPGERLFARIQAPRVEALEARVAAAAAGLSCVSERDAEALRTLGARAAPCVTPNGVDLGRYAMREAQPAGEVVFFVGDLSWPPNAEGVRWLRDRVWPELVRRRPGASVEILGRGAPPDLAPAASANGFRLLGEGGDTRPHWARAAVAAVPLHAAGGTRLKILEAAASGVPVVATPVGAEGLELRDGAEIRLRDDAPGFAEAVASLLADPAAARRQAEAARARVEEHYDWNAIGRAFARAVAEGAGRA
ncbi:MAG TPA: glycosyltransferase [Thermoanaerobaculia bacterium]|nr:glycosyltransferase [Thermoanaerobaculia bacterium]